MIWAILYCAIVIIIPDYSDQTRCFVRNRSHPATLAMCNTQLEWISRQCHLDYKYRGRRAGKRVHAKKLRETNRIESVVTPERSRTFHFGRSVIESNLIILVQPHPTTHDFNTITTESSNINCISSHIYQNCWDDRPNCNEMDNDINMKMYLHSFASENCIPHQIPPVPSQEFRRVNKGTHGRVRVTENVIQMQCLSQNRSFQNTSQLTLCSLNTQSVRNKSSAFVDYVIDCKADLFTITETWLTDLDSAVCQEITPSGYKLFHHPRSGRSGGGTALLIRDGIITTKLDAGEKTSFEFSEWLVKAGNTFLKVIIIYRPPYSSSHPVSTSRFFNEFSEYLEAIVLTNECLLITGDFNIHVDDASDADAIKLHELLESFGLVQHMKYPTHELGHILDLVITRQSDDIISSPPWADKFISDHVAVLCKLNVGKPPPTTNYVSFRKLKSINIGSFVNDIRNSDLCQKTPNDLSSLVSCYSKTLISVLEKHAPIKTRKISVRPFVPWFNDDIKSAKQTRRKAERKWRISRLQTDLDTFKEKRNYATYLMKISRQEYYSDVIREAGHDQRKLFNVSKRLLGIAKSPILPSYSDDLQLANDMGKYFIQKIVKIRSQFDNDTSVSSDYSNITVPEITCTGTFSQFKSLTEEDVKNLITSTNQKSCSLDPIPTNLLINSLDILLPTITKMINLSLQTGMFPEQWKSALVHPLLKKPGLDPIFSNFRPVSNLQFVSKLTERAVSNQLQAYMDTNNLFPLLQSAYRKFHSTETALLKIQNDILLNMNNGKVTLLVLLDLSAAFDTIDHFVLLRRLKSVFGVDGVVLSWFSSYLKNRSQKVSVNSTLSDQFDLPWGVPQGSCLGPLLFIIYASKLFEITNAFLPNPHGYADDTQLYMAFNPNDSIDLAAAINAMENCITSIRSWMFEDKLLLNDAKTEFMVIGTRQQLAKVNIEKIVIGSSDVVPVSCLRNLGSWMDSQLSMRTHITKLCSSAFYYLYNIRRIRKYLSNDNAATLIHAFISSRLDYCNSLLYGLPDTQLQKLQRVQNACARLVSGASKYSHVTPLLFDLHWLPVKYRIRFKILLLVFKVLNGSAPVYLKDLLSCKEKPKYNLRQSGVLLSFPKFVNSKKTLGDRAFSIAAPNLWNRLPPDLRNLESIDIFKSNLKTYLFKEAFFK